MKGKDERNGVICKNECNDHEEKKRLSHMRSIVEKHDAICVEIDDPTLIRFLHARDFDVEKASAMFMAYLKWRNTFVPNGSISTSEVTNQIAQDKVFMQGTDKKGRPVSVIFGGRHFPCKRGNTDEYKRFVVFALDKVCSRIPAGQGKFIVIGDLEGCGYSNIDFHEILSGISLFQDYYPERLGKLFLVNTPYILTTALKIICSFFNKNTKKKIPIVHVEKKKLKATLLEEMDESQIPEIYGGKLQLIPIQDA